MVAAYRSPRSCDSRKNTDQRCFELADLAHLHQGSAARSCVSCRVPRSRPCNDRERVVRLPRARSRAVCQSPRMSEAKPRTISIMPRAYGESISLAICLGRRRAGSRPAAAAGHPPSPGVRLPSPGPARSAGARRLEARARARDVWKSAPRIGSDIESPATADQQRSILRQRPSPRSGSRRVSET